VRHARISNVVEVFPRCPYCEILKRIVVLSGISVEIADGQCVPEAIPLLSCLSDT
jgi:hypothetical protein